MKTPRQGLCGLFVRALDHILLAVERRFPWQSSPLVQRGNSCRPSRRPHLLVEALEARELLAVQALDVQTVLPAGVLTFLERSAESVKVATVTLDGKGDQSNVTAMIDWGDGTSTPGTAANDDKGGMAILGSHVYAVDGSFGLHQRDRE